MSRTTEELMAAAVAAEGALTPLSRDVRRVFKDIGEALYAADVAMSRVRSIAASGITSGSADDLIEALGLMDSANATLRTIGAGMGSFMTEYGVARLAHDEATGKLAARRTYEIVGTGGDRVSPAEIMDTLTKAMRR